ncbi:saccharopine dehydrogenase [Streptomyces sp. NPDC047315]|uniref:saccharopine dehydrogenase n=1 Tax=Streptomyces sp. NPDC047315 TaxID=3155142 RepID=UPI0033C77358
MSSPPHLWMRHEVRASETRAPLTPKDAAQLVRRGVRVTVEESPQRAFPLADYAGAGCATAARGSWPSAPHDAYVLGLKELPDTPHELRHRHIYFGHAYKAQPGAARLLRRFTAGGGVLLDLEHLTDEAGRRHAAFGYWAGYVGAALAVLHRRGALSAPLRPGSRADLDALLAAGASEPGCSALVIGALGRCGRGARDALAVAGTAPTCWDLAETRSLDRAALLRHDVLVNTVLVNRPVPPFLTPAQLPAAGRRLSVIADVTCDVNSPLNVLPLSTALTTWERPALRLLDAPPPVDLIAIDNLPALVPVVASRSFSADLLPHLGVLDAAPAWARCRAAFATAVGRHPSPTDSEEEAHAR